MKRCEYSIPGGARCSDRKGHRGPHRVKVAFETICNFHLRNVARMKDGWSVIIEVRGEENVGPCFLPDETLERLAEFRVWCFRVGGCAIWKGGESDLRTLTAALKRAAPLRNIDWRATCRETVTAMRAAYASGKGINLSREQLHSILCGYAL